MAVINPVTAYGWTAFPRNVDALLATRERIMDAVPISVNDIKLPDSKLARSILKYARTELTMETFNHSLRVYYYGTITPGLSVLIRRPSASTAHVLSPLLN